MALLLTPLIVLSVIGFALSLITHTAALLGLPQPLGTATWDLPTGIFVLWLPTMIMAKRLVGDLNRNDFWKAALRGCPRRMRWYTYALLAYAVINILVLFAVAPSKAGGRAIDPRVELLTASGCWMAFYLAPAAILYSAIAVSGSAPARRCPNGHAVSPSAGQCEECGEAVVEEQGAEPGKR